MGRYITHYIKEHYVQRKIRVDLYYQFMEWCGESSINACLEKALKILVSNTGTNMAPNIGTNIGVTASKAPPSTDKPQAGTSGASHSKTQPSRLTRWVG